MVSSLCIFLCDHYVGGEKNDSGFSYSLPGNSFHSFPALPNLSPAESAKNSINVRVEKCQDCWYEFYDREMDYKHSVLLYRPSCSQQRVRRG